MQTSRPSVTLCSAWHLENDFLKYGGGKSQKGIKLVRVILCSLILYYFIQKKITREKDCGIFSHILSLQL